MAEEARFRHLEFWSLRNRQFYSHFRTMEKLENLEEHVSYSIYRWILIIKKIHQEYQTFERFPLSFELSIFVQGSSEKEIWSMVFTHPSNENIFNLKITKKIDGVEIDSDSKRGITEDKVLKYFER